MHRKLHLTFYRNMSSPKAEIYVGSQMKRYAVPTEILYHYSEHFRCCFNGNFKEATEMKLTLPEDSVEDFDILLGYILTGHIPTTFKVEAHDKDGLNKCIRFTEYAGKYNLGSAGMAVHGCLRDILDVRTAVVLEPDHIETVFRVFPQFHRMRALVAKAALNAQIFGRVSYDEVEEEVDGFAKEMLKHIRNYLGTKLINPKQNVIPLRDAEEGEMLWGL